MTCLLANSVGQLGEARLWLQEEQAVAFHRLGLQRGCLRHWRGFTSERKIQYGHQAIHARLAAASRQRAESSEHVCLTAFAQLCTTHAQR